MNCKCTFNTLVQTVESVCRYSLYTENDPTSSVDKKVPLGDSVSFTIPTNRRCYLQISNAAGTRILSDANFSEIHTCAFYMSISLCMYIFCTFSF